MLSAVNLILRQTKSSFWTLMDILGLLTVSARTAAKKLVFLLHEVTPESMILPFLFCSLIFPPSIWHCESTRINLENFYSFLYFYIFQLNFSNVMSSNIQLPLPHTDHMKQPTIWLFIFVPWNCGAGAGGKEQLSFYWGILINSWSWFVWL